MLKRSDDGKVRVLSLSYGKDSIATIRACELLGYPLDRIVTADVWATHDIPADLPPMWEFKKKADEIIFDRWGIRVEHLCAMQSDKRETICGVSDAAAFHTNTSSTASGSEENPSAQSSDSQCSNETGATSSKPKKMTYSDIFYLKYRKRDMIYGFPFIMGGWCKRMKFNPFPKCASHAALIKIA